MSSQGHAPIRAINMDKLQFNVSVCCIDDRNKSIIVRIKIQQLAVYKKTCCSCIQDSQK